MIDSKIEKINSDEVEAFEPLERGILIEELKPLTDSIAETGLLHPLLIIETKEGGYELISGARRYIAAKSLGIKTLSAQIAKDMPCEELFYIHFSENACHRTINHVEASFFVNKMFKKDFKPDFIILRFLPLLGHGKSLKILNMLKDLSDLSPFFKKYVILKRAPLATAHDISKLTAKEQDLLKDYVEGLDLSLSEVRESISTLKEITGKEKTTLGEILSGRNLRGIILDQKSDPLKRKVSFKKILWKLRCPKIATIEEELESLRRRLSLQEGIRLKLPDDYDDGKYTFEIDFSSLDELEKRTDSMKELKERKELRELVEAF